MKEDGVASQNEGADFRNAVSDHGGSTRVCCQCGDVADPESLLEFEEPNGMVKVYCLECALIKLGYGRFGLT